MLLSAVSVLVVAQSNSEIPEGLMNNPVYLINARDMERIKLIKKNFAKIRVAIASEF